MEITNNRPSTGERISMFVEGVSKLAAFALCVVVLLVAITFGVVYSFKPDPRFAFQITTIGCGGGILLVVALAGLAAFNAYVIRSTAAGAQAGTQKAIETLADSVNLSNSQTQATMNALLTITGNATGGRVQSPSPQKMIVPPTLQKVGPNTMRVMPAPVVEEVITVPMQDGNEHEVSFKRIEAIFKMLPEPTQDRWLKYSGGAVDQYGPTCEILCNAEPPLLLHKPGGQRGYVVAGDNAYIARWWNDIVCA